MKQSSKSFRLYRTLSLIVIALLLVAGCGLLGSDDGVSCNPDFVCSNAVSDEWTYLGLGDETITAIAVNPCNAGHILAGSLWNDSAGIQGKIFRSTNCGETWQQVWEGGRITQIVFDPQNPDVVYASPFGMIRSTDGGETWKDIDNGLSDYIAWAGPSVSAVAVDPNNPNRIYAGTAGFGAGFLFYSENRGDHWQPVPGFRDFEREGDDNRSLNGGVTSLAINPQNSNEIWAVASTASALFRSIDKGVTWRRINLPDNIADLDTYNFAEHSIKFDSNTHHLYVPGRVWAPSHGTLEVNLYKTPIGDINWTTVPLPDTLIIQPGSVRVVGLEFMTSGYQIPVFASGRGVFVQSGDAWSSRNEKFPHPHVQSFTTPNGLHFYAGLSKAESLNLPGGIYVREFKEP